MPIDEKADQPPRELIVHLRVAIDDALQILAGIDPRKAEVVELRFFGGLSVDETAAVLKISSKSVMRDWKMAKSWLMREIAGP